MKKLASCQLSVFGGLLSKLEKDKKNLQIWLHNTRWSLNPEGCYDANFVVTGSTGGCHKDNLQCHQWSQSWYHQNSRELSWCQLFGEWQHWRSSLYDDVQLHKWPQSWHHNSQESLWCLLRCHWQHQRSSLRLPLVASVNKKSAPWRFLVFSGRGITRHQWNLSKTYLSLLETVQSFKAVCALGAAIWDAPKICDLDKWPRWVLKGTHSRSTVWFGISNCYRHLEKGRGERENKAIRIREAN